MQIKDFIELTLCDIHKAIKSFNKHSYTIKVEMPSVIELDLAVHNTRYGIEVVNYNDPSSKDISRLKLTINTLNYPWINNAMD